MFGVKLGRSVSVRPVVRKVERDARLRVHVAIGADARSGAAQRARAIGADDERNADRVIADRDGDFVRAARDRIARRGFDARDFQRCRAGRQRGNEMAVLDIVAERVETDFFGAKHHLRRANKPPGVVDNANADERRGVRAASFPYAERRQRGDRTGEQGGSADDPPAACGATSCTSTPAVFERNGADQTCRSAANHDRLGRHAVR